MTSSRSPALRMGGLEWALLIALSVLWGGSFFFTEIVLEELPPITVVLGRVAIAALALHVVLAAQGRRVPTDRGLWLAFLGMGLLNNLIPFCLIVWGRPGSPAASRRSSMPPRRFGRSSSPTCSRPTKG